MSDEPFSTNHLDYLQRSGITLSPLPASMPLTSIPIELRRLWRIDGIGIIEKVLVPETKKPVRLVSEDVLIGLYGSKIPLAFLILGKPGGVAIHMGIWSPGSREKASAAILDARQEILKSALNSLYPAIDLVPAGAELTRLPLSGLVLGIPTAKPPHPLDNALPLDRLVRALSGTNWAFLVLAEPKEESVTRDLRHSVINEMRTVQAAAQTTGAPSPLAELYTQLLKVALENLTIGLEVGAWRTGVYLLGDAESYSRLASIWRAIFSGDKSLPEPVRVWDDSNAGAQAVSWAMPEAAGPKGPGHYQHPFQYQTLLNSSQLAAYVHLPQLETSGFSVSIIPNFDAMPPPIKGDKKVHLGRIILRTHITETNYEIDFKNLTRHTFVAGVTGAGKTNTIFYMLKQAATSGVPFLVIEPAKTEYRDLLNDSDIGDYLHIFTLGNENVSPFRMNPFEVPTGTPVGVHIDLLRSVFSVSFGMWTPLPQVLEQCLHRIYEDRGWDITTDTNRRLDSKSDVTAAFPTLTDLLIKVDEVTQQLGYEDKVTADIHAALHTRINSLRTGGKGRMLDVQYSLSMKALLEEPTVMELEGMGDDDDKAFVMGLLFIRIVEHLRATGETHDLRHLLVIEEAHRLLTNVVGRAREEEADPRSKAVETFANLLSEIRAYGQGVIIADQIPVKLAPEVIKNTNLKMAHRVVDYEDRKVLAGAMAMNEPQTQALEILKVGQAAVFAEGDDAPLLVQVPPVKDQKEKGSPDNKRVAEHMSKALKATSRAAPAEASCAGTDAESSAAIDAVRALVEEPGFKRDVGRLILSASEDDSALDRFWPDVTAYMQAALRPAMDAEIMLRCLVARVSEWYANRRGAQAGWSYADTTELAEKVHQVLLAKLTNQNQAKALESFRTCMKRLHARPFPPYNHCEKICTQDPPLCLYRYANAELVARGDLTENWKTAQNNDRAEGGRSQSWEACQDAAQVIVGHLASPEVTRRAGLCYAQLVLYADIHLLPEARINIMNELLLVVEKASASNQERKEKEGDKDE